MGSQLSARIRKEADAAHGSRREVERLYAFSQKLLGEGNVIQLMNAIPNFIVECFEAGAAELFLPQKDKFYRSGYGAAQLDEEQMKVSLPCATRRSPRTPADTVFSSGAPRRKADWQPGDFRLRGFPGKRLMPSARWWRLPLNALGRSSRLSETEAERQGERLKSALLDSIAHDFRTPLTSIKAAVTDLLGFAARAKSATAGTPYDC